LIVCCRLLLIQEKEQLLRELHTASSTREAAAVSCRIKQLQQDLQQAVYSCQQQFDDDE